MADAEIKALIETMHSEQFAAATSKDEMQIDTFFDKFYATDMVFIRPSGNPMETCARPKACGSAMMSRRRRRHSNLSTRSKSSAAAWPPSPRILPTKSSLTRAARCARLLLPRLTLWLLSMCPSPLRSPLTHGRDAYGRQNDDIAKYSMTFEKVSDKWVVVQAHRASGQPPAAA